MKRVSVCLCFALLGAFLLASGAEAAGRKSNVTIRNKSKWDIHHFFLSSSENDEWGPDQLGDDVLESGGSFTLTGIPCDEYDVQLVDEDDDECVVEAVDICGSNDSWVITNDDLLGCEGY
jgi:hypothetical protein